ncbi:hypothetical protein ACHAXS_004456 [Conticribra weissflogii]
MSPPKAAVMVSLSPFQKSPDSSIKQYASGNEFIFHCATESNETVTIDHPRAPSTTPESFKTAMTSDHIKSIKRRIKRAERADALRRVHEWAKERYGIEPKSHRARSMSPVPGPSNLSGDNATATFTAARSKGIQVDADIIDVSYDSLTGLTYQAKKMYEVLENIMHDDVIDGEVAVDPGRLRDLIANAERMLRRTMDLLGAARIRCDDSMECD